MKAEAFLRMPLERRREWVLGALPSHGADSTRANVLAQSKEIARIVNPVALEMLETNLHGGKERVEAKALRSVFFSFEVACRELAGSLGNRQRALLGGTGRNVFEMAGAQALARANNLTRGVSTRLGETWESIASLSSRALSVDRVFGVKIKDVDMLVLEDGVVRHTQLKTQKNTLTGSQTDRTIRALSIHAHPLFVACLDNDASWTFPKCGVERRCGREFWPAIGVDYDELVGEVTDSIKRVNDEAMTILIA